MPLYEYHCIDCGENFEKLVLFSEMYSLPECPACHSTHTQKLVSIFAGSGLSSRQGEGASQGSCAPSNSPFR